MPSPLASIVFWVAVLCCVVAEVAIVRSAALVRRAAGVDAGWSGAGLPAVRRGAEVMWAVLPALALAGVLWWTWHAMQQAPAAPTQSPSAAAAPAPAGPR